jgi:hypothetical protein
MYEFARRNLLELNPLGIGNQTKNPPLKSVKDGARKTQYRRSMLTSSNGNISP